MKTTSTLLVLGAFALLTACGGTKQDPLADTPKEVKLGKVKPDNRPDDEAVLKVDSQGYYIMREGEDQEITIKSRALLGNSQFRISLLNASDFEGAVITTTDGDETTGTVATMTIKWKVPTGLVQDRLKEMSFNTFVETTNFSSVDNFKRQENIPVLIYSESTNVPVVTKVIPPATPTRENTTNTFQVFVTDADSAGKDAVKPSLFFTPDINSTVNITSVLSISKVVPDPAVANGWIFDVKIDLTNAEITQELLVTKFNVHAKSRFEIFSTPVPSAFTVWTSVSAPTTSWDQKQAVTFKKDTPNIFTFSVNDPRGEGKVYANFKTNCSTFGAACSCKSVLSASGKANGMAQCTIAWTPSASSSNQNIEVEMINQSPVASDTTKSVLTFIGTINLVN